MAQDFGKLAVGVRVGGRPDARFFCAWTELLTSGVLRPGDAVLQPAIENPHHWTANCLAHEFLAKTTCDTVLMLDDDMVFDPEQVSAIRDHDYNFPYGIVQGLCCSRKPPHAPIVLCESTTGYEGLYAPHRPDPGDTAIEVDRKSVV